MTALLSHTGRPVPAGAPRRQVAKARRRARRCALGFLAYKRLTTRLYRRFTPHLYSWELRFSLAVMRSRTLFDAVEFEVFPDRMPEVLARPVSIVGRQVMCLALDDVEGLS